MIFQIQGTNQWYNLYSAAGENFSYFDVRNAIFVKKTNGLSTSYLEKSLKNL